MYSQHWVRGDGRTSQTNWPASLATWRNVGQGEALLQSVSNLRGGAGEMAQQESCLPHKPRDPSSIPSTYIKQERADSTELSPDILMCAVRCPHPKNNKLKGFF